MLSPRLTNCPECANIPDLLKKINCKLAELGNNLYNNVSYMLNKPVPADDILQLIGYKRILTYKYCNPNYVHQYSVKMIASRVIRLTAGCVSRCNEPERCLEEPCDVTIVPNPSTTTTSTTQRITTTTSSSSTTTTTTTLIDGCIIGPDIDITIGTQIWASSNLRVSTYTDGTPIPQITDQLAWSEASIGAWCYINNDPSTEAIYGKLYNWYAVMGIFDTASASDPLLRKQLAPTGYHVPSASEFTTLVNYLGGSPIAGAKLKQTGFTHWLSSNTGATNETCFSAVGTGYRNSEPTGDFQYFNFMTSLWSSDLSDVTPGSNAKYLWIISGANLANIIDQGGKPNGCSVRVIKD